MRGESVVNSVDQAIGSGKSRDVRPAAAPDSAPLFQASKERLRLRLYLALAGLDAAAVAIGFLTANLMRFGDPLNQQGLDMATMVLPLFLIASANTRAYSLAALERPRLGIARSLKALLFAVAVVIGFLFYMKVSVMLSRLTMGLGTINSLLFVALFRSVAGRRFGERHHWSFVNQLIFVDDAPIGFTPGAKVVHAAEQQLRPSLTDPIMLDRLGRLVNHCDRLILLCSGARRAEWSRMLKGLNVDVEVVAPELEEVGALAIRDHGGRATVLVSCGPLGIRDRLTKRLFDLTIAVAGLIFLSPVLLATAIAIKLEGRGPILFSQPRVGRGNRIFQVHKFRSMRSERADQAGTLSTRRADDRVTRVGRFIRRTSIDELPQLINVLKGEMSIVGPRPHALASTAGEQTFWQVDARYAERHVVKPGITGLAQVKGFRGATDSEADLVDRLQADLDYLAGWSIWRDVRIILGTFRVLTHRNAY